MNIIKSKLKVFYISIASEAVSFVRLALNYYLDFVSYKKHSLIFNQSSLNQIEAKLILNYHSLEKGMLFKKMKPQFGKEKVIQMHNLIERYLNIKSEMTSQVLVSMSLLCKYYEIHQKVNTDISSYYSDEKYLFYKKKLDKKYNENFSGVVFNNKANLNDIQNLSFMKFVDSRKSIREFTGELVSINIIQKVIKLANTSPSVCNRQSSKVYLVNNKDKVRHLINLQGGFKGYDNNLEQLIILTNDINYFYSVGERYQFFIDGGIYLMNLLYALNYYGVANCPANWAKEHNKENVLKEITNIPQNEKVICLIPIGIAPEKYRTTLSKRRSIDENLYII